MNSLIDWNFSILNQAVTRRLNLSIKLPKKVNQYEIKHYFNGFYTCEPRIEIQREQY